MMVVTRRAPCFSWEWEGNKISGDTARGQITCNHISHYLACYAIRCAKCQSVETPPFHQAILTFRQKYLLACNFILYKFVLASGCYIVKTSGNSSDNITFISASFFKVHLPPPSLSMTLQPHLEHPKAIFLSLMLLRSILGSGASNLLPLVIVLSYRHAHQNCSPQALANDTELRFFNATLACPTHLFLPRHSL